MLLCELGYPGCCEIEVICRIEPCLNSRDALSVPPVVDLGNANVSIDEAQLSYSDLALFNLSTIICFERKPGALYESRVS